MVENTKSKSLRQKRISLVSYVIDASQCLRGYAIMSVGLLI